MEKKVKLGRNRKQPQEVEARIKINKPYVTMDYSTFSGTENPCRFIDDMFGEYWSQPVRLYAKNKGFHKKRRTISKSIEDAQKKMPEFVKIIESSYINFNSMCDLIDTEYNESFKAKPVLVARYGYGCITRRLAIKKDPKNKKTHEDVLIQLNKNFGNSVSIDFNTYKDVRTLCRFIDIDLGDWWATPHCVLNRKHGHPARAKDKRKKTMMDRYGVDHISKNRDFLSKILSRSQHRYNATHWKTGEKITCTGTYEAKSVLFLNKQKINYIWQPKTFNTPLLTPKGNTSTYNPDVYLPDQDIWIEIKGYFRKDAKDKWEWFHKEYPNSHLWDCSMLKYMGII
jgi:hypothetical protein